MGSKGSQQVNTTQSYTPNPYAAQAIQGAMGQAQSAASQPFQQPVAPVAGFSPDQLTAFNNVNSAQGSALPFINAGANLFQQSAQGPNVAQMFNPFAGAVASNLQDIFGQQQSQVTGSLQQAAGGVGADRIAVGQSELAKQQGLAAGQTLAGVYAPALQAAMGEQGLQQGAGYGLSFLGPSVQNTLLQGANAQLGTGGLQQQLAQAQMNAPYQNTLARLQYPFQASQFLTGSIGSLAPALGGTQSGTTQYPSPSPLAQILGGGLAGAGLLGGLNQQFGVQGGGPLSFLGNALPKGAFGGFRRGGAVNPYALAMRGYADGGAPDMPLPTDATFADRAAPIIRDIASGTADAQGSNWNAFLPSPNLPQAALPPPRPSTVGMVPRPPGAPAIDGTMIRVPDAPSLAPSASSPNMPGFVNSPWAAIANAGLGMLAASGQRDYRGLPMNPFSAIGQGGLQGMQTLQAQQAAAQKQETIDQAAARLSQEAQLHREQMAQAERLHGTLTPYQAGELDLRRQTLSAGLFDKDTLDVLGDQYLAGDKSVFQNLSRGAAGPQNIVALRGIITQKLAQRGLTGADQAAAIANYNAEAAAARSQAVREGNVTSSVNEALQTFPLAQEASHNLPRGTLVPWNKLVQLAQEGTSDPNLARFVTAIQGARTAYSQAMSRTGVNSVHAQQAADHLLSTVTSQESFDAVLDQMSKEMRAAQVAPEMTRRDILSRISGRPSEAPAAASVPPAGKTPPAGTAPDRAAVEAELRRRGLIP
jgi:hypothetical protein